MSYIKLLAEATIIFVLALFVLIWGLRIGYNRGRTNRKNIFYMLMSISAFLFAAPFTFMMLGEGKQVETLSFVSSLGGIEFSMFLFGFMINFYSEKLTVRILEIALPICGLFVIVLRFITGGIDFGKNEYGYFYKDVDHYSTYVHYGFVAVAALFALVILGAYFKNSKLKREKLCLAVWIVLVTIASFTMDIIYIFEVYKEEYTLPSESFGVLGACMVFYGVAVYADMLELPADKVTELLSLYSTQPIVFVDNDGYVTYCNENFKEFFGLNGQKIIGKDMLYPNLLTQISREEGKKLVFDSGILSGSYPAMTKDGRHLDVKYRVILDRFHETRIVVNIINDITSSVEMMEKLDKEKKAAEAANEAKSAFLANMSHEIRTPMNAILGLNEMIMNEDVSPMVRGYTQDIYDAGQTLLSLINDILDFSKVESGKMEIVPVSYEMSSLLNDVINIVSKKISDKGLELATEVDEKIPYKLWGDEVRIRQVILNILNNAVKYTETGTITLKVEYKTNEEDVGCLIISVKDTGSGIKEEDLSKIFDMFQRINMKANRRVEGTGLGLAITRQLTEQMGGKIDVESEYTVGSTFTVTIPQKIIDDTPMGDFNEAVKRSRSNDNRAQTDYVAPDARILIVDDNRVNLTVARGLLKPIKAQVDAVMSGEEALTKVRDRKYDIIFIDHMMPEMDGEETLKQMLSMEDNQSKEAKMVALTANAISGSREMYLDMGFDDYLSKPINSEKYLQMVKKYLKDELIEMI